MSLPFVKVEGAGNDFVLLDAFAGDLPPALPRLVPRLCDRRRGVGADGVLVVGPHPEADFGLRVYNADGSPASMCGNGLRCAFLWLRRSGRIPRRSARAATPAGPLRVWMTGADRVAAELGRPRIRWSARELCAADTPATTFLLEVGTLCLVCFLDAPPAGLDLARLGPAYQRAARPDGEVNVVFAHIAGRERLRQRVWERGCGETAACATGAGAALVAGRLWGRLAVRAAVEQPGGTLTAAWEGPEEPVAVAGPAAVVFTGSWGGS